MWITRACAARDRNKLLKAAWFHASMRCRHPLDPATGAVELPGYREARARISQSALAFLYGAEPPFDLWFPEATVPRVLLMTFGLAAPHSLTVFRHLRKGCGSEGSRLNRFRTLKA